MDIFLTIVSVCTFVMILVLAIEHWRWVLIIAGLVLINLYSYWAALCILLFVFTVNLYDGHKKGRLKNKYVSDVAFPDALKFTGGILLVAVISKFIFMWVLSGSPCDTAPISRYC